MKSSRILDSRNSAMLLFTMCTAAFILGCQTISLNPKGRTVPEAQRITMPESGELRGIYETEDLTLSYSMFKTPSQLYISGEIRFAERIAASFSIMQYFNLSVLLLDSQGKALNLVPLTTVSRYGTQSATPPNYSLSFNTQTRVPEVTRLIAFTYSGRALEPRGEGYMNIWEYPVY